MIGGSEGGITRRAVLRDGTYATLALMVGGALGGETIAVALPAPGRPLFLTESELRTLRALVDVFIPPDEEPGGAQAGCADAIDALLGAFEVDPPLIYAGGGFSGRRGSRANDFEDFVALDPYERRGWRLRIKGSHGRQDEVNGPVVGWQEIYRDGLAALDRGAGGGGAFARLPLPLRELAVRTASDRDVTRMVDIAWPQSWQFMYGAPEYGGNRELAGWRMIGWDGDVQPRGWSPAEVRAGPDVGSRAANPSDLPIPLDQVLRLAAIGGSAELIDTLMQRSGGTVDGLQRELGPLLDYVTGSGG